MNDLFYHILVISVAAYSVIRGFRNGFTGQVPGVLGLAFGLVCAHIFAEDVADGIRLLFPSIRTRVGSAFTCSVVGAVVVYVVVYMLFKSLTGVFRKIMEVFEVGILDCIFGSVFSLLKYMLGVSIFLNLLVCVNPRTPLMKHISSDDGNIVGEVMLMASGMLGCVSCEDLHHHLQLRDATRISCNITTCRDVIECSNKEKGKPEPATGRQQYKKIENA